MEGKAIYMLLQEEQPSDFSPAYLNFPDSQTGQSLIALLNVSHPLLDDATKIEKNFESCIIYADFFHFGGKKCAIYKKTKDKKTLLDYEG